jgi:hypothetical protein
MLPRPGPPRPRPARPCLARNRRPPHPRPGPPRPDTQTVTLVLDATTGNIALFAIAANADEREAHVREVERYGRTLPEDSYGRRNRQAIAARETRVATRLRPVEQAYNTDRRADLRPGLPLQGAAVRSDASGRR